MSNYSVLIPDGESPFAVKVLACLSDVKGLDIHLLSQKERPLSRFSWVPKSFGVLKKGQGLLDGVVNVCARYKVDFCMPIDTEGIYFFSQNYGEISKNVKLSVNGSSQTVRKAWDKGLLAEFLFQNSLHHPFTITSIEKFERNGKDLVYPVLIKPRLGGGGLGIEKIIDRNSLLRKIENEPNFFEEFIVQEFFEGEDIDCSVLCKEGEILAYTIQKRLYPARYNVYSAPNTIEFLHEPQVLAITANLMKKLIWTGIAHVDLRISNVDGRIMVIEVNPRFWGSLEGSKYAGVNFAYLAILAGRGEAFPLPEYANKKYSSALSALKRALKNEPSVSLLRETNLENYLRDPLIVLARLAGVE